MQCDIAVWQIGLHNIYGLMANNKKNLFKMMASILVPMLLSCEKALVVGMFQLFSRFTSILYKIQINLGTKKTYKWVIVINFFPVHCHCSAKFNGWNPVISNEIRSDRESWMRTKIFSLVYDLVTSMCRTDQQKAAGFGLKWTSVWAVFHTLLCCYWTVDLFWQFVWNSANVTATKVHLSNNWQQYTVSKR